jgi:diketogulonate reductase-like aldo/keto reductase
MEGKDVTTITLNSGYKIPQIGLGTFLSTEGEVGEIVKAAILEHGYRHIDTARIYNNEEAIGKALQECFAQGIKREDLFITTKLWQDDKHDVEGALRESLRKLQLDYIDLYLIHWMVPSNSRTDGKLEIKPTPTHEVWRGMESCVEKGLTKSIGVSNCTITMLVDLLTYAKIKPATN